MRFRLAAPAIFLASLLLLPFLNKPFTIDDPLYLREAEHALVDPAHPADFEAVWNEGDRLKLSQFMAGGTLPAYVMAPVAALGSREWVAHLYQWLLLCVFLLASVGVARQLGCDATQSGIVGLLVGANPITLAMAATCMPDIMAAMFGTLGMERILAFRNTRSLMAGLLGALSLAAATQCRATTVPLIGVAVLLLWPDSLKRAPEWLWPVAVALLLGAGFALLARSGPGGNTLASSLRTLTAMRNIPRNLVGFFAYQALTGPLLLYWLLMRGRWAWLTAAGLIGTGVALSTVVTSGVQIHLLGGALAICAIIAIVDLVSQLRGSAPLVLWLLSGLVALPYVFMAAKYLLPGLPAAALLIVLHSAKVRMRRYPVAIALLIAAGWIAGAAVIVGDTTLANSYRAAVTREVLSRIRQGRTVWAGGSWSFDEYARRAGAKPLANQAPFPSPGDFVVISAKEYNGKFEELPFRREFLYSIGDRRCGVFVLNRDMRAGFYSNRFGYLPFTVGCGEVNRFDVYRAIDTLKN